MRSIFISLLTRLRGYTMKQIILLGIIFLLSTTTIYGEDPPGIDWEVVFPGAYSASSVVQVNDGGYLLAGNTFDGSDNNLWFAKTDSEGALEWDRIFGGEDYDTANNMIQSSDSSYVGVGYSYSFGPNECVYLIKLAQNGYDLWETTLANGRAYNIIQTDDGGYCMVGNDTSTRAQLIKTDQDGNAQWIKNIGWGDIGYDLIETADGSIVITGFTDSFSHGGDDVWLAKTDSEGDLLWQRTYGWENNDYGYALIQTYDGGFAITGTTPSGSYTDLLLIKVDAAGNELWTQTLGGPWTDGGKDLVESPLDSGLVIVGTTNSFGDGSWELYQVKTDSVGNEVWSTNFGEMWGDHGYSIVNAEDGKWTMAGDKSNGTDRQAWLIQSRLGACLEILIEEYQTSVPKRGTLDFQITYTNNSEEGVVTEVSFEAYLPGHPDPAWGVHDDSFLIDPGDAIKVYSLTIPTNAPILPGYTFRAFIHDGDTVLWEGSFNFEVKRPMTGMP